MLLLLLSCVASLAFAVFEPLDKDLSTYLCPFPVHFHEVKLQENDYRMAYMDLKTASDKSPVAVLLHGKNFNSSYWEKTARDLLKLNYRVVMIDQIGFGKSSKPDHFPYSFHYLAKLSHNLLASLKIKQYVLIGHSMGGMLATRMALMYPEEVKKLILVNPIGLEDWKTKVSYKSVDELYKNELASNEESIRNYQKANYFNGVWKDEYEKGIEVQVGWTRHPDYPKIAWNSALTTDMIFTQPVLYEFPNLKAPTLLLLGTRDRTAVGKAWAENKLKPELGRYDLLGKKVVKSIPKGTLVELPEIGHLPQVEAYDQYWKHIQSYLQKK